MTQMSGETKGARWIEPYGNEMKTFSSNKGLREG